jgi:hypothetical protein
MLKNVSRLRSGGFIRLFSHSGVIYGDAVGDPLLPARVAVNSNADANKAS